MMHITTFHIEPENVEFVQELTNHKELSRVLNFLILQYKENKGYVDPHTKIEQLTAQLKKKEEQFNALQREASK